MPDIGHSFRNVQQRLLVEIEFLRQNRFFRRQHAQPLFQKIESSADGQRRRSQHHRVELIE